MAMVMVLGEEELRDLARDLRKWESTIRVANTMEERLKALGERDAARVKTAIRAIPSKNQNRRRGKRSLRSAMVRATDWRYSRFGRLDTGVSVFVSPARMPPGQGGLPALMEGERRWTHPTFGHKPNVFQAPHPYFAVATRTAERDAEAIGNHCVNVIADDIERG